MQGGISTLSGQRYHQLTKHGRGILMEKLHMLEKRWIDIIEVIKNQTIESYEFTKNSHELQDIDVEMQKINYVLKNSSDLVPEKKNCVTLGSTVTIDCNGQTMQYQVVSSIEADPEHGYVSDQSPLGVALLGKCENDIVHIERPRVSRDYKIVKIEQGE